MSRVHTAARSAVIRVSANANSTPQQRTVRYHSVYYRASPSSPWISFGAYPYADAISVAAGLRPLGYDVFVR